MNRYPIRIGTFDARLFSAVIGALKTLGVQDAPITEFEDLRHQLEARLQRLANVCSMLPADMRQKTESSLVTLLNISRMVSLMRTASVFQKILPAPIAQTITAILQSIQTRAAFDDISERNFG